MTKTTNTPTTKPANTQHIKQERKGYLKHNQKLSRKKKLSQKSTIANNPTINIISSRISSRTGMRYVYS